MAESVYQTNKTKTKFRPFKTDENEIATYTIAAMYFALIVFPFLPSLAGDLRPAKVVFSK